MHDSLEITGKVDIKVFDNEGTLKTHHKIHNTVTTVGKEHIADRFGLQAQDPMITMAIGTGTPSATALGTEVSRKEFQSQTSSGLTWTYVAQWSIDDDFAGTITEAGIFNAESGLGGVMLCSSSFTSIVKALNDSLVITWTITIA
ncbi:MAG: hypothetical protein KBC17_02125 [Candidatus Pacebacteria bacterium]|nr:hypothetical protein [Candidatus Paceibacterota bacterium]